ncbi:MAG: dTDP-4-dehydrorhamnose reductase [uncultured Chthoniobacterales bacterium]|uniref:dTDP-4-dehydrorhamnose reductase n=1 Tax=uncultured Chthoniobacterales bacterium TaxID=1836801 RepID=A0A6J4I0V5_9BACT|nr:MAG: dTDP-4-dehydrorhamnose reductase [uncultured Chthoniobacterales bacterium]
MDARIVIVGAGGRLGAALLRDYTPRGATIGLTRQQLDLADAAQVRDTLGALDFDVLINCAAQTNVDRCETHPDEAFQLNAEAPGVLAEICTRKGAKLVHISTDYVFDGEQRAPYTEDDAAEPISVYGESKRRGEQRVLEVSEGHLVVRVSWVFGPDRPSFVDWAMQQAREKDHVEAIGDKFSTPSYTLDLADMLSRLMSHDDACGIFHLTNGGACSWQEYGQYALDCCVAEGIPMKTRTVGAVPLASMEKFIARRPVHTTLSTAKYTQVTGHAPREWRHAVADYVRTHVLEGTVGS